MTTIIKRGGRKVYEVPIPQTGQIAFYRDYKEPLVPLEGGYGYDGVVLYDQSMEKIQCAFCGGWFETLGTHIRHKHNMTGSEYREEYGLMKGTVLMGEKMRNHTIQQGIEQTPRLIRDKLWTRAHAVQRYKRSVGIKIHNGHGSPAEYKNKKGTCAEQLLAWMRANPDQRMHEDQARSASIVKTFGSWNRARKLAHLEVRHEMNRDEGLALECLRVFVREHHRVPYQSDGRRGILAYSPSYYARHFGTWGGALRLAGLEPRAKHSGMQRFESHHYLDWIQRYKSGETCGSIGESYGCHESHVSRTLHAAGVQIRPNGWRKKVLAL